MQTLICCLALLEHRPEKVAKIWLHPVSVEYNRGYHQAELNRILRLTRKNLERLEDAWNAYFSR
ncbi:MAG: DUF4160 domain-containing protein [Gemmatimonadetes bacterium]|nr:DUF4160 domain-containing protein [Gemmatimonadota bacterium]